MQKHFISWSLFAESFPEEKWDGFLQKACDATVFQSLGWGEYKRKEGWIPERWVGRDKNGAVVGMVQILFRKVLGVCLGWAPGGPCLQFPVSSQHRVEGILESLPLALTGRHKWFYTCFFPHSPATAEMAYAWESAMQRPSFVFPPRFTYLHDLSCSQEEFWKQMTSKHRYYLKKALREEIEWRIGEERAMLEDLSSLNLAVSKKKALSEAYTWPLEKLKKLIQPLAGHFKIVAGYAKGEPISSCLVLNFSRRAFYMVAATSAEGRRLGAGYAMVYKLLETLKAEGFEEFDFGGVAPKEDAEGVNHFKRGFGGRLVQRLGEGVLANPSSLQFLGDFLAKKKRA